MNADVSRSLLSVLRDDLDLTGTKFGCGEGQCAACTVLVDGQPTKSCLTKVGSVAGKRIVTIEGLAEGGKLHPVQEAFLEADAMQCGWCTPGMILGAVGLLTALPQSHRRRYSQRHGRAHLPLRDVSARDRRDSLRGRAERSAAMRRRDFFAVLGGGIVVLLIADDADAQESGGGARRGLREQAPEQVSAWLHIGETGAVTAFTGKVEVGQNARTSLTQAIAEELRTPVASISMVMGDTALTPFDMGTFGSRTTPTMWPQMRKAAAAAREMLIDLAAKKWSVDRASITVANGRVTAGARSAGFGELTHGEKLEKSIPASVTLEPAAEWKIAGTSAEKVNGRAIVTGAHRYSFDMRRPGMLLRQGAAAGIVRRAACFAR